MNTLQDYRAALHRLIENKPQVVPKDSAINKDTVALEAGRKRGSIKKSRTANTPLIAEIEAAAAAQQAQAQPTTAQKIEKQKILKKAAQDRLDKTRESYEIALIKIVSLVHENHALQQEIKSLKKELIKCKHVNIR
ncbi:hypothetical protein [Pseudomonas guariconensis]|uniref:hypothetical protein n=1 Tax=Pseudomonas guariconensis TaxID=1288410 RepID=UPI0034668DF0